MLVNVRKKIEREIVSALIKDGIAAGYSITVHDGQESVVKASRNPEEIIDSMFSVDEESLFFTKDDEEGGWVLLIYGNDGYDVIADHSKRLNHIMISATQISDHYEDSR